MSFTYLASPYSHPNPLVRQMRYVLTEAHTAKMLRAGEIVYSPIVHCHNLALAHSLPTDAKFWETYNYAMLRSAYRLTILKLPGYKKSRGIDGEIQYAEGLELEIIYDEFEELSELAQGLFGVHL